MGVNTEEDEFLVAWLKKREYVIVEDNFNGVYLRKNHVTAFKKYDIEAEHLNAWVTSHRSWTDTYSMQLHHVQRGKRRPLRSAVREWVIGI